MHLEGTRLPPESPVRPRRNLLFSERNRCEVQAIQRFIDTWPSHELLGARLQMRMRAGGSASPGKETAGSS